ncbi:MAG TPA: hypothetical protein VGM91_18495 [Conexibacter sp.]|jgi:hypothetical protein
MLFDLQSRGRRTAVKIVYVGLAVLIGGGLVLFGVGTGGGGGGLLDIFNGNSTSSSVQIGNAEKRALREVRLDPNNAAAWGELARARFQDAGQGDNFNQTQGTFTAQGQTELRSAKQAWDRYLVLNPNRPDANLARLMAQAFAPTALNQPAEAAEALEIVTESDPSSAAYAQLAQYAWLAGQTRKGDLASQKAIQLAPASQRALIRRQLDAADRQIQQQAAQDAVNNGSLSTATTPAR